MQLLEVPSLKGGKNCSIVLVGPTGCGKSFVLNTLELICKSSVNPYNGKYTWVR